MFSKNINIFLTGLIFFSGGIAILSSCKKDTSAAAAKTVYVTEEHAWSEDPEFNYNGQNMLNGFTHNGKALFYGTDDIYNYDSTNNQWGITPSVFPLAFKRIPINKDFYITSNGIDVNTSIIIHSTFYPNSPANYPLNFSTLDTNFIGIQQMAFGQMSKLIEISDSNRVIFPVVTKNNVSCYYLVDVKPTLPLFTVSSFTKVFAGSNNYIGVYNNLLVNHINNRFFVTNNNSDSTYLIRENYSVKGVMNEAFGSVFKFSNNYYAIGQYTGNIYKTTDLGETWSIEYAINPSKMIIVNFDSKLLGIYQDQIWEIILGSASITLKEINNDGLSGKKITDILKINNKVYILTNGGVYSRPNNNFYEYK